MTLLYFFGGILFIDALFVGVLFWLAGRRVEKRKPTEWGEMYISYRTGCLDEHEKALGGDVAQIEEIQSN